MNPSTPSTRNIARFAFAASLAVLVLPFAGCRRAEPGTYASPEEAIQAAHNLIGPADDEEIEAIFGPGSADLFRSGDPAADRRARRSGQGADRREGGLRRASTRTREWRSSATTLGHSRFHSLRIGKRWRCDTAAGQEELLNRRIGYNELSTLASLHEFVDAQFEYVRARRDGNPAAFAQQFISSEGAQDGLYWPTAEGEPLSPLGDLLAAAALEKVGPGPQPFNGYLYRILKAQGPNAPGGERSYLDKSGRLTRGFAAIAWPAKHGNSGVMTFIVNQRDIVFQKDLGADTEQAVAAIQAFDPDTSWEPTGDSLEEVEADAEEEPAAEPAS